MIFEIGKDEFNVLMKRMPKRFNQVRIKLTGLDIPREHNSCDINCCERCASTAVWAGPNTNVQINVCNYHLKEKLDTREWWIE